MRQFYRGSYLKYHTLCDKFELVALPHASLRRAMPPVIFTCTSASRKTGVSGSSTAKSTRFSMTACWPAGDKKAVKEEISVPNRTCRTQRDHPHPYILEFLVSRRESIF